MIVGAIAAVAIAMLFLLWLMRGGHAEAVQAKPPVQRDRNTIHRDEYLSPEAEGRSLTLSGMGLPTAELKRIKGRLVLVTAEGMVNPRSRSLHTVGLHTFQVRGTDHYQPACENGDFRPGMPVRFFREPHNPYDPNAVAVLASNHDDIVGYVNKQTAGRLAKLIDRRADIVGISLRGSGPGTSGVVPTILAAERHVVAHLTRSL